jgi:predicted nucleic acid-binding protein
MFYRLHNRLEKRRTDDFYRHQFEKYGLSHNMKITDALIAATAMVYDLELITLNRKDFQFLPPLKLTV